jgi:hypothetical protein
VRQDEDLIADRPFLHLRPSSFLTDLSHLDCSVPTRRALPWSALLLFGSCLAALLVGLALLLFQRSRKRAGSGSTSGFHFRRRSSVREHDPTTIETQISELEPSAAINSTRRHSRSSSLTPVLPPLWSQRPMHTRSVSMMDINRDDEEDDDGTRGRGDPGPFHNRSQSNPEKGKMPRVTSEPGLVNLKL